MGSIEDGDSSTSSDTTDVDIPMRTQDNFIERIYRTIDETAGIELERLRVEDGIIPTCTLGCYHCCKHHILVNIAEARILTQYIKREFSSSEIDDLRVRTQQWHAWDNSRPGRYPSPAIEEQKDPCDYEPCCPLVVKGACSAYPVRPVICRTHFVSCSDTRSCRPESNPEYVAGLSLHLESVIQATGGLSKIIRESIEREALDYNQTVMLLPHWLAKEMGWVFDVSS